MTQKQPTNAPQAPLPSRHKEAEALAFPLPLVNLLPADWPLDVPLVRIRTCGCSPIVIEVLHSLDAQKQAIYAPPDNTLWKLPGMTTAPLLLELLASQPGGLLSQDLLMQRLGNRRKASRLEDEDEAFRRPENVVTLLRKLLYPLALQHLPSSAQRSIRLHLVAHISASRESGPSYRLASAPLVWLDVEAMEEYARQAALLARFGSDPLPVWQNMSEIGLRGSFLPHEPYSDWASWRRMRVDDLLWQSVDAQCQRARKQEDQQAGEEEALQLVFAFWQGHLTNEDAFRQLADLLGKRERFQQVEECYAQLCAALEYEGDEPHERTLEVMKFVRALKVQRKPVKEHQMPTSMFSIQPSFISWSSPNTLFETPHSGAPNGGNEPPGTSLLMSTESDILTRLATVLSQPAITQERDFAYFDQQTRLYWRAREEMALPPLSLYASVLRHIDDLNLLFARSHLSHIRRYLCEIACRTTLLAGMLLYDGGSYAKARHMYQLASQAAMEANNLVLQSLVSGWMSFTWTYEQHYAEALTCIQHARFLTRQTSDNLIQAWFGAIEAEIQAHLHNHQGCLQALREMEQGSNAPPSPETSYLFEFNPALLLGYKGVCLQQLYLRHKPATYAFLQEAKEALEQALNSEAPLKRKLYYLTDLAGVYARQGEVEAACAYMAQSIPLLKQMGNGSETVRKHLFQARTLLHPHKQVTSVQELDEQMAFLLLTKPGEGESTAQGDFLSF